MAYTRKELDDFRDRATGEIDPYWAGVVHNLIDDLGEYRANTTFFSAEVRTLERVVKELWNFCPFEFDWTQLEDSDAATSALHRLTDDLH